MNPHYHWGKPPPTLGGNPHSHWGKSLPSRGTIPSQIEKSTFSSCGKSKLTLWKIPSQTGKIPTWIRRKY